MKAYRKLVSRALVSVLICNLLLISIAYALPTLTPHPHDEAVIKWEKDGKKDGSSPHNHRSTRDFGGFSNAREPYTASKCWDNEIYRVDQAGTFDSGHCFIDETAGANSIPDFYFVGTGWPAEAKQRVRDAFAAWGAITSDKDDLITGIAFEETSNEAQAEIKVYWENQNGANNGGEWNASARELRLDSSMNWYYGVDPKEGQPGGIQNDQWHFYSVVLHETGHAVALGHQNDVDDLMTPPVGEPPNTAGHRYFMAPDVDSIEGVRDLYSQPHSRVAFVIDDTGSMWEEIGDVKTTVSQKVDEFVTKKLQLNYHLLTYKDDVNYRGHTTNPDTIKSWVNSLYASGGGDCPEEMLGALNRIAQEAPSSEAWVMTDAGFHGSAGDLAVTIYNLIKANVTVHPIIYSWCFSAMSTAGQPAGGPGQETCAPGVAPTELLALGPDSFAQIAFETGGHYFYISSAQTQAATSILLNEMVTTSDLTTYMSQVTAASPKTYLIAVDLTSTEANFLLNEFSGNVSLVLLNPVGTQVHPGDPGVKYTGISNAEYYQVAAPMPGVWQAQLSGDGTFAFSASGQSAVSMQYLSDTSLAKNVPVNLLASLTGPIASSEFQLTLPDGTLSSVVSLFDDGLHGDEAAGDGIFGGMYTPITAGSFYFRAKGTTTDGSTFERVAPELLRVQSLSVTAPADQTVLPGTSVSYDFAIANGSESQDTFDLTTSSSQGWADLSGVPASVTIAGGATAHVVIPVNVPASAANGTVEETILAAVSQSNPLVNDTASVRTTVGTPLPTTSQLVGWTFLDTNGDGWRQANEQAGLAGVSLTLTQSGTPVAQTRSVGVDGWYHFNSVMPGQYCLRAAIPSQYVATSPAQVCFNVVAGTDKIVNFGVQQARAAIGDYVWYDDNANGVQDPGELGLAGVTLDLLSNNGGAPGDMVATATTDADGRYLFDPVAPGAYFVQVTDTQGRLVGHTHTIGPQSRPNPFGPITVVHGQTYLEADFGYAVLPGPGQAVIGDRVWLDANGNGVQDAGEVGIAGVRICASPMGHASDVCGHTDQGGFYHLLVTAPRTYMVTVVAPPAGKQATTPVFYLPVGVGPGDRYQVADFGYR